MQLLPILSYVQHYKKYHAARFEAASVQYGLNQLEIDILLFLHNNPDCRTASDICRYRGLAKSNVSAAVERLRGAAIRILRAGVPLGTPKGRDFVPAPELALSTALRPDAFPDVPLCREEALSYLRRDAVTLPPSAPRGFVTASYGGLRLGFLKNIGNRANNLFPDRWKIKFK